MFKKGAIMFGIIFVSVGSILLIRASYKYIPIGSRNIMVKIKPKMQRVCRYLYPCTAVSDYWNRCKKYVLESKTGLSATILQAHTSCSCKWCKDNLSITINEDK
jgi:hypothetical protein